MRPFGFEQDRYTVRQDEAALIREAATKLVDGASLRSLASDWNERGIRTTGGNDWKPVVLRRTLLSPRVVGKVERDGQLLDAPWDPIIDADTAKKVQEVLAANGTGDAPSRNAHNYLLTGGIAVCGLCGKQLVARPDNRGRRGYVCASGLPTGGCGRIRISREFLEEEVVTRILARLLRDDARETLTAAIDAYRAKADRADADIAAAKERREVLAREFAQGNITAPALKAGENEVKKQIAELRQTRSLGEALGNISALEADSLIAWWEAASTEQQRTLLNLLIERVTVGPASIRGSKKPDPTRIKITWR